MHHRRDAARRSLPHTDRLGLQHRIGKILAQIGGLLEQSRLKGRHGVAHRAHAAGARFHPVGQVQYFGHHRVFQQGAEDHKPVQPGVPFTKFHSLFPLIFNECTKIIPLLQAQCNPVFNYLHLSGDSLYKTLFDI